LAKLLRRIPFASILTRILVTIVVGSTFWPAAATPALAAAYYTKSYYVQTTDTTRWYNIGCQDAQLEAQAGTYVSGDAVLDFGTQDANATGSILIGSSTVTPQAAIEAVAEQYAIGVADCLKAANSYSFLTVAIGTNNSRRVSSALGAAWAHIVDDVASYVSSNTTCCYVSIDAAIDFEPGWAGQYNPTLGYGSNDPGGLQALAWVQAVNADYDYSIDYGSADGCPADRYDNSPQHTCDNAVTQDTMYQIAWGLDNTRALPEIYYNNGCCAEPWTEISRYGVSSQQLYGEINFDGAFTEYAIDNGTLAPDAATTLFQNTLNTTPPGAPNVSTTLGTPSDIRYQS
jgi:hypothetical protein